MELWMTIMIIVALVLIVIYFVSLGRIGLLKSELPMLGLILLLLVVSLWALPCSSNMSRGFLMIFVGIFFLFLAAWYLWYLSSLHKKPLDSSVHRAICLVCGGVKLVLLVLFMVILLGTAKTYN